MDRSVQRLRACRRYYDDGRCTSQPRERRSRTQTLHMYLATTGEPRAVSPSSEDEDQAGCDQTAWDEATGDGGMRRATSGQDGVHQG